MTRNILFIIFFMLGLGIGLFYVYIDRGKSQLYLSPLSAISAFSLEHPPTQSLHGKITDIIGKVNWESRTATAPAAITTLQQIQQGEAIKTGDNGQVSIQFPSFATIGISPKSEIDFIQLLPANIVLQQPSGTAEYTRNGSVPVSLRCLHLLVQQNIGDIKIVVDDKKEEVIVDVLHGSIFSAYTDLQGNIQKMTIQSGNELEFDDTSRTTNVIGLK